MKYLITGGAGFIGSHLSESLLAAGHQVSVIDDLSTGSMRNIAHLKDRPGYSYVIDTVMNESLTAELVDDADIVVHLAASVGVQKIVEEPVNTIENNVEGTDIVLRKADKKKKLVLIASTSEVYGLSTDVPFREDAPLVMGATSKHRWAYACSKALDEFLALAYARERKLPVIVVRFFNTVGPRQTGQYGMVVPRFVQQALAGAPITVYGTGQQTRCFTHVKDVVAALTALMGTPAAQGQVVNIGGPQEVSMLDLAKRVIALTGSRSTVSMIPYNEAYAEGFEDMPRRVPDVTKLQGLVGATPLTGLDDILRDVIVSFGGTPVA